MFGFDNPADMILETSMAKNAKNAKNVMDFLPTVWEPALKQAKKEAAELQKLMDAEGRGEKLEAWDWWYYTEKLREAKYALSESELRPYFSLDNVRKGAFEATDAFTGMCQGTQIYMSMNWKDVKEAGKLGQLIVDVPMKEQNALSIVTKMFNVIYHTAEGGKANVYSVSNDGTTLEVQSSSKGIRLVYSTPFYKK